LVTPTPSLHRDLGSSPSTVESLQTPEPLGKHGGSTLARTETSLAQHLNGGGGSNQRSFTTSKPVEEVPITDPSQHPNRGGRRHSRPAPTHDFQQVDRMENHHGAQMENHGTRRLQRKKEGAMTAGTR